VYCFSRERSIKNSSGGVEEANPIAFRRRLERVAQNKIASALDEFLARRVPVQLGGMQDPFSPWEKTRRVTLQLLHVLRDHEYPTIISTKGSLVTDPEYLSVLSEMNVMVRFSAAGVRESARAAVDYKCSTFAETLHRATILDQAGVPVSLRIQPIIPGSDLDALRMLREAAAAGVRHVSFEFLKLPIEKSDAVIHSLNRALGTDVWAAAKQAGIKRVGPDYTIAVPWKLAFLRSAMSLGSELGVLIGAGDTELIHLSEGGGCCNGSSAFLRTANQFDANLSSVVSRGEGPRSVRFSDLLNRWSPERPISTYLMTDSRTRDGTGRFSDWMSLIAHRWNGSKGPYSPQLFAGVTWSGEFDQDGFKVYEFKDPLQP
jgi:DNA repair photolyase